MKPATAGRLTELLDRQLAALESVLEVLDRERSGLEHRDTAALESIAAEKQERLAAAAAFEQQRRELAPSPAAMESLAESPHFASRWARLLDLTRACRDHSEANGQIVRRGQHCMESTMSLRRGRSAKARVCGADGKARTARVPISSA